MLGLFSALAGAVLLCACSNGSHSTPQNGSATFTFSATEVGAGPTASGETISKVTTASTVVRPPEEAATPEPTQPMSATLQDDTPIGPTPEGLPAEGLLGLATYEMSLVTSAHVRVDTRLSGQGSAITTVSDYQLSGDTVYLVQQTLGLTMEILQREDGVCTKEPGGEWEVQGLGSGLPFGGPQSFFGDMLNGKYEYLVRAPETIIVDGKTAYVLKGRLATDEMGNVAPVAEPAAEWAHVQITLEQETARVLSYRLENEVTVRGSELDLDLEVTIDRHNQPALFPEGLPQSCSTLAS